MRGSPHEHMFLWLEDAPVYDSSIPDSGQKCIEFIDKYITCESMMKLIHTWLCKNTNTYTCYKGRKNKNICRFYFPLPVLPKTTILTPLPKEQMLNEIKEHLKKITN